MASNNEIIVRIVVDCAAFTIGFITTILACKLALARSAAAHNREIAELQRRLKVAEEFAAEMKESTNSLVRACGHQMILRLQGEGGNDGK